jgi:hypothetical protein
MTTKQPTPCMAKKPDDLEVTCCLKLGHPGPHSWSWLRKINDPTITKDEREKQRRLSVKEVSSL